MNLELLTPDEMGRADRLTIKGGLAGFELMKAAGAQVADAALSMIAEAVSGSTGRIFCLAGPGNNGGDAFVAAEFLRRGGFTVEVHALVRPDQLSGDAALAAEFYRGPVKPLDGFDPDDTVLVIDGLFGAGLSRPLEGRISQLVEGINASAAKVLAIDLPSGVSGESGAVLGAAFEADKTVSFFRAKPGHYLEPGRSRCGAVDIRQIGIERAVLETIQPKAFLNTPGLWKNFLALPADNGHKYDRGHAAVFSGPASQTGAARLSAGAALRAGAGLVTLVSPAGALLINAAHLTAVMLKRCEGEEDLVDLLDDQRLKAFVLGPGFGAGDRARDYALSVLGAGRSLVLDADGITSFSDEPRDLFAAAEKSRDEQGAKLVLTPHAGEFSRIFGDIASDGSLSKLGKARRAAEQAGAVVVFKGRDTVIAAPDGRAAINANGTPWLATAGTGDVLTGIIVAQLSQGMPAFEAAAAGVWMHGRAAEHFGPGLIAEDLAGQLPQVFGDLLAG
ncbi:NAD(P)H-hydrate dehydratase [Fulvimarina sp. MAC3]|uniref:NAD(P)H-hydrate dehydratase n=1 Tax=Fulvimarina sp. MAC3 TaxID=3148887 RepID=UPI0031FCBE28